MGVKSGTDDEYRKIAADCEQGVVDNVLYMDKDF